MCEKKVTINGKSTIVRLLQNCCQLKHIFIIILNQ